VPLAGLGSQSLTATTVGATREVGEPQLFTGVGKSASTGNVWHLVFARRGLRPALACCE
jgi:hypothetical protein